MPPSPQDMAEALKNAPPNTTISYSPDYMRWPEAVYKILTNIAALAALCILTWIFATSTPSPQPPQPTPPSQTP